MSKPQRLPHLLFRITGFTGRIIGQQQFVIIIQTVFRPFAAQLQARAGNTRDTFTPTLNQGLSPGLCNNGLTD
ncbi:MAG: hypothetical protein P8X74_21130 [Reinekea sp.]